MAKRNIFHEAALELADEMRRMRGDGSPAVPFGKEKLSARDHAVRVFGPRGMTNEQRQQELDRIGVGEMLKLAETYSKAAPLPRPSGGEESA